ncbi:sensor histidine kinase, HAMP and PAS domain-containing [Geotalea daltonii FRC-32]|uniref:histidine kinase n=1 Tax=Geotalea daltonii (strain DSM 22248 / JCM 15807 / FRC-32) TaxID=316067 RepID=B9M7S8_GEODF|nr:ATP-binding protein [Geotalea daltonii]ACM18386.1 sensor histidine kinase, HAMP and PAS domain-containing [Geotalea daltonii FRC-32]
MQFSLSIRSKLFLSILLILVVSYTTLLFTTVEGLESHIEHDIGKGLEAHLNYARSQFYVRAEQIKYSLMQPIMAPPVQQHLIRRDSVWLKDAMRRWKKVLPFVDVLTIIDPQNRVIARYNNQQRGDLFGIHEIVRQMYRDKKAVISIELVDKEFLQQEEDPAGTDTEAMVVLVAIPVFNADGTLLGGVVAGDKINNDPYLPFQIQEIFGEEAEVAVSQRGMRIASNRAEDNIQTATVESHVIERLQKGYSYRGKAEIGNNAYETVFEPLTNSRGEFVGSLSVALSRENMQKIRVDSLKNILMSAIVGILLSFVIAFIAARKFAGPILELANGARRIELGDLSQRVMVRNNDEIGDLAGSFNRMVNALAERDSIISRKNNDLQELNGLLEKKVSLRTAELSMEMGRLETILTSMVEGVLVTDSDSRVILFNPAAQAILGIVPYKVIGQSIEQLGNSGEFSNLVRCIQEIKETWGPVASRQEDLTLKGKKLKINLAPMAREGNEFAGIVMSLRDITAEEEIDRMKTEFISTVSHELKTPLTSMKGSLQLLLNRGKWLTETERQLLSVCLRNTQRLIRMISEILDISRMESGGMDFTFKPLSMGELVVYAIEEIKTFAHNRSISIVNSLGDHLPLVYGDHDRLIQVLTNLLSNAVKFSPEGKIVMVLAEREGNYLVVSVTDRARAIQWSDREKLFKKFQQLESDQPMQGGTGLGLAICKEIIEKHHGKIYYNAGKEGGNVFSFTVPIYEENHGK